MSPRRRPTAGSSAPAARPAPRVAAPAASDPGPPWRELLAPRGPLLVPLIMLVVTRIVAATMLTFASEDAYITFRYARNLIGAHALVFNPGERVLGVSSVPWTLWCALGLALTHHIVVWTRLTSLVCEVAMLLLLARPLARHGGHAALFAFATFFAVWPYFAALSVSGMEMSAMLALIALGARLATERPDGARGWLTGLALGLLALWRPEGPAAAAVLAIGARWRDRLIALLVFAAGIAGLTAYYGSPIPQSLSAKAVVYGTPGPWAARQWWNWAVPMQLGPGGGTSEGSYLFPLAVLLFPAALLGAAALWRDRRGSALALAAGACGVVWGGYAVIGVAYFWWYMALPVVALALLAAVGLPRITRSRLVGGALALFVLTSWIPAYNLYVGRAQNEYYGFAQVASWLYDHARPGEKLMLEPIGFVGYVDPLIVVDEVGLVSPEVSRRRKQGPGWYADVVRDTRPDWLVVRQGVLRTGGGFAGAGAPFRDAAERDSLLAHYQPDTLIDQISGDAALLILERRGR